MIDWIHKIQDIFKCIITLPDTINEINQNIKEIKYKHTIEHDVFLCETCHKGKYPYKGIASRGLLATEKWICDNCGAEAPLSWINKRNISQ